VSKRKVPSILRLLMYLFIISGAIISLIPFMWMIMTSFKSYPEVATRVLWPGAWTIQNWQLPVEERTIPTLFHNYIQAWTSEPFGPSFEEGKFLPGYFLNSLFIAGSTILGVLFTSILAAYAFARLNFFGKNVIFIAFLATMMIPGEVTLIPNFLTIKRIGWYDTYWAMIIPWTASVFYIFLLRQFFMTIPQELYDAALLDGCGHLRFLIQIVLPLSKAAIITVAMLTFIGSWNALLWPLIVTSRAEIRPIAVGLTMFVQEAGTQTQELMAAATLTTLPILLFYFMTQRQFTEGIATSGLKG